MPAVTEFRFHTKLDQTILLGRSARTIPDLLDGIRGVPPASIYFHTHRFLQQHMFLSPEPPNDFAHWVTTSLNENNLGEQLSGIDIVQFTKISDLRSRFIEIIEGQLGHLTQIVEAPPGEEFYFMASQTFVLQTPYTVRTLAEFADSVQKVTVQSLSHHIFDARLRLERGENDFSAWFRQLGYEQLAREVLRLDPYTQSMESLRKRIVQLVRHHDQD